MRTFIRDGRRGFSMVEVVVALGVTTFCLVILMGLLAVGSSSDRTTIERSIAANIAGAVMADLRATPLSNQFYTPTAVFYSPRFRFVISAAATPPAPVTATGMQTVYVDNNGTPLPLMTVNANLTSNTGSYRVTIQGPLRPPTSGSPPQPQRLASPVYILVTWPGQSDPTATTWPSHYSGSFEVVTYLDQN